MKICPKCRKQYEGGNFCENCENEDGSPVKLEEEKITCPQCGRQYNKGTKFCSECGVKLGQTGSSSYGSGISMGDKNVIAGDVIGHKETYNVSGNATIVHNEDETKKTAKCHICGSIVQRIHGYDCPDCGEFTCEDCFDKKHGICKNCVENKVKRNEENYRSKVIEFLADDNRIDAEEFKKLHEYQEQLGIGDFRAMEIQDEVKSNSRGKVEFTTFEKLNFEKAEELFYDEGESKEALNLLESIYKAHPEDEKVLSLYLPVLADNDIEKAKKIISEIKTDEIGAYLTAIEIAIQEKDMATAERRILEAERIWPESVLVKCHKVLYRLALYEQFNSEEWLEKAEELSQKLGEPTNKLELSWQVKVQCMVSEAKGDEPLSFNSEFCKENQLYYSFLNKTTNCLSEEEKEILSKDLYSNSEFNEDGTILEKYNGKSKVIYIPNGIVNIEDEAFFNNEYIEKIIIEDSVINIGAGAFSRCTLLKEVIISDSVTNIGNRAFDACSSLNKILLSNKLQEIHVGVFSECTSLETIVLPDSIKKIGSNTFEGCKSLKQIKLSDRLQEISFGMFSKCYSLEEIELPDSIKRIDSFAFEDCRSLSQIISSESIESVERDAFVGCSILNFKSKTFVINNGLGIIDNELCYCAKNIIGEVIIPGFINRITNNVFDSCELIESIIIPDSVIEIGSGCFRKCVSLKNIVLSKNISSIQGLSFDGCTSLQEIEIPLKVYEIGMYAFRYCESLVSIKLQNNNIKIAQDTFKGCIALSEKSKQLIIDKGYEF